MLMLMLRQHEEIAALTEKVKGLEMMVQRAKYHNKEKEHNLEKVPDQ